MTDRIKKFLPAIILGLIVLILAAWYMMSVPAPVQAPAVDTTTATAPEGPKHITEDAAYYTVDAQYPSQTALKASVGAEADQAAVVAMKTFIEQQIALFKDDGNFANLTANDIKMQRLDERKYSVAIAYKTYSSASTVSYVFQIYEDTGGAHPNTYYRTFTFDTKTGAELALEDLFTTGTPYLETLSVTSRAMLPPMLASRNNIEVSAVDTKYIASGTLPDADAFQNFYLTAGTLVIVFPPYQIGPYILGMVELPIPASKLKGFKTEYAR